MAGISPAVTNMVIVLGMVQLAKRIPFDDPNILWAARGVYIVSNLIIFGVYMLIRSKIYAKKDLTTLKYIEPAPLGSAEEPKAVTTTIQDYDLSKLQEALRAQAMGIAMMGFMHLYMKYTNPLLIQSVIPLKGLLDNNLVKIHLLGKPASGDLRRPFKQAGGLLSGLQPQTQADKKSVAAVEGAGRGGAKEE